MNMECELLTSEIKVNKFWAWVFDAQVKRCKGYFKLLKVNERNYHFFMLKISSRNLVANDHKRSQTANQLDFSLKN